MSCVSTNLSSLFVFVLWSGSGESRGEVENGVLILFLRSFFNQSINFISPHFVSCDLFLVVFPFVVAGDLCKFDELF